MTALFIDVSNLAWRAFYTTGHLEHNGNVVGVIYGVLRDIKAFRERFNTDDISFFFDHPHYFRRDDFPWYKMKPDDYRKKNARREVHRQMDHLRHVILPALGFSNLYYEDGFEADDLIATATTTKENVVMLSSDEDLYQLLNHNIRMFKPIKGEFYTIHDLRKEFWGVVPCQWPKVKAIAGCTSDNIMGCFNVGEFVAAKYLVGKLGDGLRKTAIEEWLKTENYGHNLTLTTLPYSASILPDLIRQPPKPFSRKVWNEVVESLGMVTLMDVRKGLKAK